MRGLLVLGVKLGSAFADILAYVGETVSEYYFVGQGLTE